MLAFFGVASVLLALPPAPQDTSFHYYYFDQKRPLVVDASRIAVYQPGGTAESVETAVRRGATVIGSTSRNLSDWRLIDLEKEDRSPQDIKRIVVNVADGPGVLFVSPVFVGDDVGPMNITPFLLVEFEEGVAANDAEALLATVAQGTIVERRFGGRTGGYRIKIPSRNGLDVLKAANTLAQRPEVRYAEPDMIFTGRGGLFPNDPGFGNCWGIHNTGQTGGINDMDMDGPEAWDVTTGSSSILVVVIDTGVQQDHPDIHQLTPGIDTTSDGGNGGPVNACDNHGTPVAGCVSATINNALGTVGIAPGCRTASARTFISNLSCSGSWTSQASWTVASLSWAQSIGARVTNNSNYYGFASSAIASAYENSRIAGLVHFASAGNDAASSITYPANLPTVNSVAALNDFGSLASFSNFGVGLDFSAPGQSIYTTDRTGSAGWVGGDYVFADGTSFASPYSAGVAALILSINPTLTAPQVEEIMQQTCDDLGTPCYDTTYGWGFVNANNVPHSVCTPDPDASPPQPNPMTFDSPPTATSPVSISMTATEGTDATPPVQYLFQCTGGTPGGTSSFWQIGVGYTDTGLQANAPYSYRVAARDSNTPTPNQSAFSAEHNISTAIETPQGLATGVVGVDFIELVALGTFTNLTEDQSGLYFDSLTPGGDTGLNVWVQGTMATASGLMPDTDYEFVVKARNRDGIETALCAPISVHTYWVSGDCNNDLIFSVESDLDCIVEALLGNETSPPGGAHRIDLNYNEITDGEDIQFILDCLQFGGC